MPSDKRNSSWLSAQYAVSVIISLITLKLNLGHFGKELFGVWIFFISIWNVGPALDLGFSTALVKYVAETKNKKSEYINILISTSFFSFISIGVLLLVSGNLIFFPILVSNLSIIPKEYNNLSHVLFLLLGFSFFLSFISLFFKAIFEGSSNFVITSKVGLLQNILIICSVLLVTYYDLSIITLAIFYVISQFLVLSILVLLFRIKFKLIKIRLSLFRLEKLKEIGRFSLSVQLVSIFNALIDPLIKYIIGSYNNVGLVSIYEVARRFAVSISLLFFTAFKTILPKASVLSNKEEYKIFLYNDGVKYTRLGIIYSGLAFGIFSIFIALFLNFWFGYKDLVLIFLILALPESVNNFGYTIYNFILGIGKASILVLVQLTNLIFVVVGMILIFIIFRSELGLLGYFFSVLLGNALMLYFIKRITGIEIQKFLKLVHIKKLLFLITVIFFGIILIYNGLINYIIVLSVINILSIIVFYKDIFNYIKLGIEQIRGKKVL